MNILNQVELPETEQTAIIEEQSDALIPQINQEGLYGEDEDIETQLSWEDPELYGVVGNAGAEQLEIGPDHLTGTNEGSGIPGSAEADRSRPEGGIEDQPEGGTDDQAKNSDVRIRPYPTPVSLPPTAFLLMAIQEALDKSQEEYYKLWNIHKPMEVQKATFIAGYHAIPRGIINGKIIDKAKFQ